MTTTERLDRLEKAHRALSAQHLALQTIVRIALPTLISPNAMSAIRDAALMASDISVADEELLLEIKQWVCDIAVI